MRSVQGSRSEAIERSTSILLERQRGFPTLIEVLEFKNLCDLYGHIVSDELPLIIKDFISAIPQCIYAELVLRGHLTMECAILAIFSDVKVAEETQGQISEHTFNCGTHSISNVKVRTTNGDVAKLLEKWTE